MFRYSFIEFLQDISNWLIIGLVIAALISAFVPDNFFADKIPNSLLGMIIILVVAIPVYICATASVPIAAVLMLKGLSPGAALVLLMAGPATNAATMTMIGKVLGKRSLISYLFAIITGAIVSGLIIDNFLPPSWFSISEHFAHLNHSHDILPMWLKNGSAILLGLLIINGYIQKYYKKTTMSEEHKPEGNLYKGKITVMNVSGMTCNHCRQNVENAVRSVNGVDDVSVDLVSGDVSIMGNSPDLSRIRKEIESIGYKVHDQQ